MDLFLGCYIILGFSASGRVSVFTSLSLTSNLSLPNRLNICLSASLCVCSGKPSYFCLSVRPSLSGLSMIVK